MIESLNLEKSVSREYNKDIKLIKSNTLKNIDRSLRAYKEEYKYTPLFRKIKNKIQIGVSELDHDYDIKKIKESIPKNDGYRIIVIDGLYNEELSNIPTEISVKKFSDLSEKMKGNFQKAYQGFDDSKSDLFSSINTINHFECLTVYVDKGVNIKKKISIINYIDSSQSSYFSRNKIFGLAFLSKNLMLSSIDNIIFSKEVTSSVNLNFSMKLFSSSEIFDRL